MLLSHISPVGLEGSTTPLSRVDPRTRPGDAAGRAVPFGRVDSGDADAVRCVPRRRPVWSRGWPPRSQHFDHRPPRPGCAGGDRRHQQRLISSAEVAETPLRRSAAGHCATYAQGRLIVRRIKELKPVDGHHELFTAWPYHAVSTDTNLKGCRPRPPPPARHHRTGHRRPEEQRPRAPAVREVYHERHLADLRKRSRST